MGYLALYPLDLLQESVSCPVRRLNSQSELSNLADGILQSISLDAKAQDDNMQSAFQDLEVLMVRAGEMVCHVQLST